MRVMPEKNPDVWTQIWHWFMAFMSNHNGLVCGVIIAFFTSITKSFLYGKSDTPTPYIEQQHGFTVDGVLTKVRIDAGVNVID